MENKEVDNYLEGLNSLEKEHIGFLVKYMRENHSDLEEVISFQMPTYKLGSGKERNYVAFSYAKNHYSLHTMDFEYIQALKEKLSKPGKGKGCVNIKYNDIDEQNKVLTAIEEIIERKKYAIYGKKQ